MAVLPISTLQTALPPNLLSATMLLQPTIVLILPVDWQPPFCLCFLPILLSFHGPSRPYITLAKILDSFFLPIPFWQNPSPGWMEPSAFFVCACARTVEILELNYTSPWSINSQSSTSNGSEYCLALFLQTGFCWHHSTKTSQPVSPVILMTLLIPSHSLVFKWSSQIVKKKKMVDCIFNTLQLAFTLSRYFLLEFCLTTFFSPWSFSCLIIITGEISLSQMYWGAHSHNSS